MKATRLAQLLVMLGAFAISINAQEDQPDMFDDQPAPSPSVSPPTSFDQAAQELDKNMERWKAEHAKWQQHQLFANPGNGTRIKFNQEFTLGGYSYKITDVRPFRSVGPEFVRETASDGATFLVVHYLIRNEGKQTAETDANDFRLVALDGREYSPDSRATNTLSTDFVLRELHPGIFKKAVVAFEVPEEVVKTSFKIVIPEKGLFKEESRTAFLLLKPKPPKPSPAQAKPNRQTRARTSDRHTSHNADYEEMRREILLNRPPGTSSTDYDPDWR
ncbi:MAG TPA: DUF4352 domain-containing protein [Chthoniobacterales bacterium]|jgi:hypothetical protein|nr:DUF4352 domain-containing protein [Chthoniobacterales bacterium]